MMKTLLPILVLVTAALAAPGKYEPIQLYYHENVGIAEAARIKAAEEALDFDGSRISGGSHSRLGEFPYMGGLVISLVNGQTSVCGSALISHTKLTTAAHCWWDGRQQVRMFTVVLASTRLFSGGNRINTNRVNTHPNYDYRSLHNDVAVITINHVNYNNYIKPIALASGSNNFVGQIATVAGFGRTADNADIGPYQVLSHVNMPVISNQECNRIFGSIVVSSTLCTSGANRRGTCRGDSGGALILNNQMIGIASFGSTAGCQRGYPSGFARVTYFNSWIRQHM